MATRLVHHRSTVMVAGIPANASPFQGARAYCPSLIGLSSSVRLSSVAYGLPMRLRLSPDNRRTRCVMAYRSLYLHWRSAFTYFCCLRAPDCACCVAPCISRHVWAFIGHTRLFRVLRPRALVPRAMRSLFSYVIVLEHSQPSSLSG